MFSALKDSCGEYGYWFLISHVVLILLIVVAGGIATYTHTGRSR